MTTNLNAHFAPVDAHLADCEAGQEALQEYELAREQGKDHLDATIIASNVLQRAGYNVNAKGGVTIDHSPEFVTFGGRLQRFEAVVKLMDDEIREDINSSWDDLGETQAEQNQRFVDEYAQRHADRFGAEFVVA